MKYQDLLKLKKGDIVIHKKSKEKFIFNGLVMFWDGHFEAECLSERGFDRYFEAKDIML